MTCPSCHFENMKNAPACARCGAVLVWNEPRRRAFFLPRRAQNQPMRKAIRRCGAWARRRFGTGRRFNPLSMFSNDFARRISAETLFSAVLSIVPGGGYVPQHRINMFRVILGAWVLLFLLSQMHPSSEHRLAAFIFMVGLHIFSSFHAVKPWEFCQNTSELAMASFILLAMVAAVYGLAALLMGGRPLERDLLKGIIQPGVTP